MEVALVPSTMPVLLAQFLHLDRIDLIGRDAETLAKTFVFATIRAFALAAPSLQPLLVAQCLSADAIARGQPLLDRTHGNSYKLFRGLLSLVRVFGKLRSVAGIRASGLCLVGHRRHGCFSTPAGGSLNLSMCCARMRQSRATQKHFDIEHKRKCCQPIISFFKHLSDNRQYNTVDVQLRTGEAEFISFINCMDACFSSPE